MYSRDLILMIVIRTVQGVIFKPKGKNTNGTAPREKGKVGRKESKVVMISNTLFFCSEIHCIIHLTWNNRSAHLYAQRNHFR